MANTILRKDKAAADDDIGDITMTADEKDTVKKFTKFFNLLSDAHKHELIIKLMLLRRLSEGYVVTP